MAAQRQMSLAAVWGALESADLAATLRASAPAAAAQPATQAAAMAADCRPLWGHPPLAAALLQQPQVRPDPFLGPFSWSPSDSSEQQSAPCNTAEALI